MLRLPRLSSLAATCALSLWEGWSKEESLPLQHALLLTSAWQGFLSRKGVKAANSLCVLHKYRRELTEFQGSAFIEFRLCCKGVGHSFPLKCNKNVYKAFNKETKET